MATTHKPSRFPVYWSKRRWLPGFRMQFCAINTELTKPNIYQQLSILRNFELKLTNVTKNGQFPRQN